MISYNERLKLEIVRRDAALVRMNYSGVAAAAVAQAKFDRTAASIGTFVSREINHASDAVSEQIDHARNAYRSELEHTKATVESELNDLKNRLNPENLIRAHPWGTTLGAMLAAALLAPLVKSIFPAGASESAAVKLCASNETAATHNGAHHSRWKPLTDALLA